jgi:hypothetical protein
MKERLTMNFNNIKAIIFNIETRTMSMQDIEDAEEYLYHAQCLLEILPDEMLPDHEFKLIDRVIGEVRSNLTKGRGL